MHRYRFRLKLSARFLANDVEPFTDAAREIIRAAFPSNANLDDLVDAAISGSIGGYTDKAFDVMSFARPPSDSKNWMGGDLASRAAGA